MENFSYPTYPDSANSTPRSRDIDCENASWDEPPPSSANTGNYKVKLMCSYGGKIHPRPHDNQLAYVGGDTKIVTVDRSIKFSAFMAKLSNLIDSEVCFKYQLPGEDLDALISVTNDEDLDHMMMEYDRLFRASAKPARLRLFLFPVNPQGTSFGSDDSKSGRQWFVDALNSAQIQNSETSSPAASAGNPDYLFGLEKSHVTHAPPVVAAKGNDPPPAPVAPEYYRKEVRAGSDCGSEDRHVIGEPLMSPTEFQRLQIATQEQGSPRVYGGGDYYVQRAPEKLQPSQAPVGMTVPAGYWPERQVTAGGYPMAAATAPEPQPVYLIQSPSGVYQAQAQFRPMPSQFASQAYYGGPRVVQEVYREQPTYNAAPPPPPPSQQQTMGMMRQPATGIGYAAESGGYMPVAYDGAGRQVYYTTAGGGAPPSYLAVPQTVDGMAILNQEGGGKIVPSNSTM